MAADAACASLRFYKLFFHSDFPSRDPFVTSLCGGFLLDLYRLVQMWGEGAGGTQPIYFFFHYYYFFF